MGHLYFTRHGQTTWNVANKICGTTDVPLTDYGKEQALELGKHIKNANIKIDEILYSPLERARDTALCIAQETGIPAKKEPLLVEQCFGKWEGTSPRNAPAFVEDKKKFVYNYETGESMFRMAQRIYNLLDRICAEPDKTYLLVAHNGISRFIESYFTNMSNEEFAAFGIKNCEIREYKF